MSKRDVVKSGLSLVIGIGFTKIVSGVIESNVSTERPIRDKVPVAAAELAVGYVLAQAINERVGVEVDRAADWFIKHKPDIRRLFED